MERDDYEDEFSYEEEQRVQDVSGVVNVIKTAWKLVPTLPLAKFFDISLPSNIAEMEDYEIIEALEEFIHQNR